MVISFTKPLTDICLVSIDLKRKTMLSHKKSFLIIHLCVSCIRNSLPRHNKTLYYKIILLKQKKNKKISKRFNLLPKQQINF